MMNIVKKIPVRYLPRSLTRKDKGKQVRMLMRSRSLYKKNKYYTRKEVPSYKSKPSQHVVNARRIYNIQNVEPSKELVMKTGCKLSALNKIVSKGEGAYYSSGSRPNQTAQSWGVARLASSVTGGKASAVDFKILEQGCNHTKKAYKMAKHNKTNYGRHKVSKVTMY